jgi:large subunit ribosomal protein L5
MKVFELKAICKNDAQILLQKKFGYKNVHEIPKLKKIVISSSFGLVGNQNKDYLSQYIEEYRLISGQHPIFTKAKKAISNFKTRKGMILGLMVTLRKQKMYAFLKKLIHLVLPNIKDFAGIKTNMINKNGSFNLGIKKQDIFPEISYDSLKQIHGFNINFSMTSKTKLETITLLKGLGFPFIESNIKKKDD